MIFIPEPVDNWIALLTFFSRTHSARGSLAVFFLFVDVDWIKKTFCLLKIIFHTRGADIVVCLNRNVWIDIEYVVF